MLYANHKAKTQQKPKPSEAKGQKLKPSETKAKSQKPSEAKAKSQKQKAKSRSQKPKAKTQKPSGHANGRFQLLNAANSTPIKNSSSKMQQQARKAAPG